MPTTINSVSIDANSLFSALTQGVNIDLNIDDIVLDTDFPVTPDPSLPVVEPLTIEKLTQGLVGGDGVFDKLMAAVNAQIGTQYEKGRITGSDYANVYLGAIQSAMQFAIQYTLGNQRAQLENLQILETVKLAQVQRVKAMADIELVRAQLVTAQYNMLQSKLQAHVVYNQYASTKMDLVLGFNSILEAEGKQKLINEQFESQRAQTLDTRSDGTAVNGVIGTQRDLTAAQVAVANEDIDTKRAQTKETLQSGGPIMGLVAIQKETATAERDLTVAQSQLANEQYEIARAETKDTLSNGSNFAGMVLLKKQAAAAEAKLKDEQYEIARAQVRDSLSTGGAFGGLVAEEKLMKAAQRQTMEEQLDTARASTKDTLLNGQPVAGIAAKEKMLKDAQARLVDEQYESQRGQTRTTLSSGATIAGILGAQVKLYDQQVISYKRDAESKGVKMLLDTWVARKTVDDGVAVPVAIDTAALESIITGYRANLVI